MYQIDVRKIAIRMYAILSSLRKTAKLLGVSHSSIHRWLSHLHRRPYARRPSPKADVVVDVLSTQERTHICGQAISGIPCRYRSVFCLRTN
jgi:transposase-like protein